MTPERTVSVRWSAVLAITVVLLVAADALLLGLGTGYFSLGFNAIYVGSTAPALGYLLGAAVLDAALVLGAWTLALPLLRRFGGGPVRTAVLAMLVALIPALLSGMFLYHVHVTLGRLVSTSLLAVGSAGRTASVASMVASETPPFGAAMGLIICLGGVLILLAAWRIDAHRHSRPAASPRLKAVGGGFLVALFAGALVLGFAGMRDERLHYGWIRKASGLLITNVVQNLSDWDRDGYGWLSSPGDPEPLDSTIHPYAVEIPGNAIDENGIGGDRPANHETPSKGPMPTGGTARPNFLLVFLESFRADLLDGEIDGKAITPFLASLAAEGARSEAAYVHSPWTLPSRSQLFAGDLVARAGEPTLVDDFLSRGYGVAHFSGQDDSYGDSASALGLTRADRFYDAREDLERRTTRATASVSLQVSWKTVLERVEEFLASWPGDRPLFLYVNLVDTHYPYTHGEIDEIFTSSTLSRDEINAANAAGVFRAYANTAANVDRAVEKLVGLWRARFPGKPSGILVTGDHGQSFYESETLGHGQTLNSAETRVPFILSGIGGTWPEPLAISDVRGLLAQHLFRSDPRDLRAHFRALENQSVFHYLGPLDAPEQIGIRTRDGVIALDVRRGRAWRLDASEQFVQEPPSPQALNHLIWTWEALHARVADSEKP